MRKVTKSFIWASIFDCISTIFALNQGCIEMNIVVNKYGWGTGIAAKVLGTIVIIYLLEKFGEYWFFWIGPILIWIVVVWNIINGVMEMI